MTIRKLIGDDIAYVAEMQKMQGLKSPEFDSIPDDWSVYAAFDEEKIVSICYLFRYKRIPHADYPTGTVAELGGAYTLPEYRGKGIMSAIVKELIGNCEKDLGKVDALIADSTDDAYGIYIKNGAHDSTEHRIWWQLGK